MFNVTAITLLAVLYIHTQTMPEISQSYNLTARMTIKRRLPGGRFAINASGQVCDITFCFKNVKWASGAGELSDAWEILVLNYDNKRDLFIRYP
jgi:hypothetical protein